MNLNWFLFLALPVHFQSIAWIGLGIMIVLNLRWVKDQQKEFLFIILATGWGFIMELIFIYSSSINYPQTKVLLPPLFMLGLWVNFACTFSFCLKWLLEKPVLAVVFGTIMGPFAYFSGSRISVEIDPINTVAGVLVIAVVYLISMIVLPFFYKTVYKSEKNYVPAWKIYRILQEIWLSQDF